jgi:hypothetical protein
MKNAFFFQTQQIPDTSSIFDQLKQQNIFFSYFQVDQNYYLFLYGQESIDINFLYQSVNVIQELDSKQRKIRSLRGFFLYALEILENGKDYEILETNLQPFFWRKVKNIIRQNKKAALQEFLFGSQDSIAAPETQNHLNEKIESLETQLSSLQQKVIDLEAKLENPKSPRSGLLEGLESTKSIQQSDSTLEVKKGPYLPENNSEVRDSTSRGKDMESKSFSEDSKIDFKTLSHSQQYNISSNEEKGRNRQNFVTLGKISDEEKIEIIKLGFQLQNEGKISLKKYYESTDPYSLSQFNGYSIKYESIRRTKFYQQLKLSNN